MYVINKSSASVLERPFIKMGARVKLGVPEVTRFSHEQRAFALDVRRDGRGEYFLVRKRPDVSVEVLEVRPAERHLVLLARVPRFRGGETKSRFLLGHDERHWFVAAIPEDSPVSTVAAAKQALKPEVVTQREIAIRARIRDRRINKARIRQGEWFFVPVEGLDVVASRVLKNEPLRRGGGKPHVCQELYRSGGETVYVNRENPNGLTQAAYARLSEKVRSQPGWSRMV